MTLVALKRVTPAPYSGLYICTVSGARAECDGVPVNTGCFCRLYVLDDLIACSEYVPYIVCP